MGGKATCNMPLAGLHPSISLSAANGKKVKLIFFNFDLITDLNRFSFNVIYFNYGIDYILMKDLNCITYPIGF